jgi:predicted nicotinamide N-methyase
VTVWHGALLLARYLELRSDSVSGCRVLELGAGCGVVGIAAAALGAQSVLLTDLPYVLPLLKSNMDRNQILLTAMNTNAGTAPGTSVECCECDWCQQPLNARILEFSPNVILVADCVWVQDLVQPLLSTLQSLVMKNSSLSFSLPQQQQGPEEEFDGSGHGHDSVHVLISYQRRGKGAHEAFWKGLSQLFSSIECIDTAAIGLDKPETLQLLSCRR